MSEPKKAKVSLKEFIDEYYHVIAVMGVFAALTALFIRLEGGEYLAFVTFIGFILLDWEIYSALIRIKSSRRLLVFQIVLFNLLMFVSFYIVIFYGLQLVGFLIPALLFIYGGAILKIISKMKSWKIAVALILGLI